MLDKNPQHLSAFYGPYPDMEFQDTLSLRPRHPFIALVPFRTQMKEITTRPQLISTIIPTLPMLDLIFPWIPSWPCFKIWKTISPRAALPCSPTRRYHPLTFCNPCSARFIPSLWGGRNPASLINSRMDPLLMVNVTNPTWSWIRCTRH